MTVSNEIAVVDVETTGLFPGGHDRVIEIAVVRIKTDGTVLDEYVTLVNPERDIGRSDIHGIEAGDVLEAPAFRDILGDVCGRLEGAVIGGHNVEFDARFLDAELARAGHQLPTVNLLCSMRALGGSLASCCRDYEVDIDLAHSALHDARATASLLVRWFSEREPGQSLESMVSGFGEGIRWPSILPSGRSLRRTTAVELKRRRVTFLARLVERLPVVAGIGLPGAFAVYYNILDRVLEDRRVSDLERDEIEGLAAEWGLSQGNARDAHIAYLSRLVTQALADGSVSETELLDLQNVAELLGVEENVLDSLLVTPTKPSPDANSSESLVLAGKSVCFTGELQCTMGGLRITRERAEELAAAAGLVVLQGVTRKLDILVLADPDTQSGKAKKARSYGTRLIADVVFWKNIGVAVD